MAPNLTPDSDTGTGTWTDDMLARAIREGIGEPLVFKGRAIPATDLDRYLQAVFAISNAGTPGRPSVFHMAHVLHRHRHTQRIAAIPVWVQRIVLPVIVWMGGVLGKYPASGWPGAPQSCQGAPEAAITEGQTTINAEIAEIAGKR